MIIEKHVGLFTDVIDRLNAKTPESFEDFYFDDRYGFRTKYGTFNTILEEKRAQIEELVGEELYPVSSSLMHMGEMALIAPSLGPYTQDISVIVPIREELGSSEFGTYDGDTIREHILTVGDVLLIEGFKVVRWLFPLPQGEGYNLYTKFNYVRKSDPCAEFLKWDGYPDMFGEGTTPDRLNRTQPDYYDRVQRQCFANYGTEYWDNRATISQQFDQWLADRGFPVQTGGPLAMDTELGGDKILL